MGWAERVDEVNAGVVFPTASSTPLIGWTRWVRMLCSWLTSHCGPVYGATVAAALPLLRGAAAVVHVGVLTILMVYKVNRCAMFVLMHNP